MIPFFLVVLFALAGSLTAGCASRPDSVGEHGIAMAPLEEMPVEVQVAPLVVRRAYQFAAANPAVFTRIPCYCGCAVKGHTSNYACYVAGVDPDDKTFYDLHALACTICVDITHDTVRLLKQGKSIQQIRAYVDSSYARYGPSTGP